MNALRSQLAANGGRAAVAARNSLFVALVMTSASLARAQVTSRDSSSLVSRASITFQENHGQWPEAIRFLAQAGGVRARVEQDSIALDLASVVTKSERSGVLVRLAIEGQDSLEPSGERELRTKHHYCYDAGAHWIRNVPSFEQVRMRCVADGVDWVLRAHDGHLEYDLELAPGADLDALVIRCQGQRGLSIEDDGSLWIHTSAGVIRQTPPVSWEISKSGEQHFIDVRFQLLGDDRFGFVAPQRDRSRELHIDPGIEWASYLGGTGSGEYTTALDRDAAGNVFAAGEATSANFPVTPGSYSTPGMNVVGIFVCKFDPAGSVLFSTYVDVNVSIDLFALAVDSWGRATVGGDLYIPNGVSADFPTTPQAYDPIINTRFPGYVLRLSAAGDALDFSTVLEGPGGNACFVYALDIAASGGVVVGGWTDSFPATPGAYDTTFNATGNQDGFVARLSPDGSQLEWSTFLGGSYRDEVRTLALDAAENVTVAGLTFSPDFPIPFDVLPTPIVGIHHRFFVSRLNAQGSGIIWNKVIDQNGGGTESHPQGMALGRDGSVVVVAETQSYFYPTTPGAAFPPPSVFVNDYNGYVFKVAPGGAALEYGFYLTSRALPYGVYLDASGVATITGGDRWSTMPITPGAPAGSGVVNGADALLCRIDPTGTQLLYSARLGGLNWEFGQCITRLDDHHVAIGGNAGLASFVTPGAFDTTYGGGYEDGFVGVADLLPQGVQVLGTSTPACLGTIGMNTVGMPSPNASEFAFWCSGAPPNASGWLLIGAAAPIAGDFGGASIQVDRTRRMFLRAVTTDHRGFVRTPMPLPLLPTGTQFAAQYVFRNTPSCSGAGMFSASNGLLLHVQ